MFSQRTLDLIKGKNFAYFGTISKNGYPHVTVTWVDTDGQNVIINTAMGRVKQKNAERDSKVSVTILDNATQAAYVFITGDVIEQRTDGADAHIDKMAKKYNDQDSFTGRESPDEKRVMIIIRPVKVVEYN
jgi:PPOX class probable F420-dependent enzyme